MRTLTITRPHFFIIGDHHGIVARPQARAVRHHRIRPRLERAEASFEVRESRLGQVLVLDCRDGNFFGLVVGDCYQLASRKSGSGVHLTHAVAIFGHLRAGVRL